MPNPYAAIGLTFDASDLQLADGSRFLEIREGLSMVPSFRGTDVLRPGLPGRRQRNRILNVLPLELTGWIQATTLSGLAAARRDLLSIFRVSKGLRTLEATLENGVVISIPARLQEEGVTWGTEPAGSRTVNVALEAPDPPYWRAAEVVDLARSIAASPTDFTLTNVGNEQSGEIVFEFTGPITNPRVTNLTNGIYVEALVGVAAGEILLIDATNFIATNDGVNAIGSVLRSGHRRWMILEPGANSMRVTATSPGGTLTSSFRPVYL